MTIEEAKRAWEKKLMAIPGVTQVGIGLTKETIPTLFPPETQRPRFGHPSTPRMARRQRIR
jgi:hypothetical protein